MYLDCDTIHTTDVAYYPHSNKVGVLVKGQEAFYIRDDMVDYYEGE